MHQGEAQPEPRPELTATIDTLGRKTLGRQLQGLAEREQAARKQVIDELEAMARDLDRRLSNPGLNPAMQALLTRLRMGLAKNLTHLLGGQSIENLPLPVELIDFGETQASNHLARTDEAVEAHPAATPRPQPTHQPRHAGASGPRSGPGLMPPGASPGKRSARASGLSSVATRPVDQWQ